MPRSALEAAEALQDDVLDEMSIGTRCLPVPRFSADNPAVDAAGHIEARALHADQGVGSVRRREPAAAIVPDLGERHSYIGLNITTKPRHVTQSRLSDA